MVITIKNVNNKINSADAIFGSKPKAIINFCKLFIINLIILLLLRDTGTSVKNRHFDSATTLNRNSTQIPSISLWIFGRSAKAWPLMTALLSLTPRVSFECSPGGRGRCMEK